MPFRCFTVFASIFSGISALDLPAATADDWLGWRGANRAAAINPEVTIYFVTETSFVAVFAASSFR